MISRIILSIVAIIFAGYGIHLAMDPSMLLQYLKVAEPHSAELMSEVHAVYVGVQTMVGAALLYVAILASYRRVIHACGWGTLFFIGLLAPRLYHACSISATACASSILSMVHQRAYIGVAVVFEISVVILLGIVWLINRERAS
jgi:hypothetical protein